MGKWVEQQLVVAMARRGLAISCMRVLALGLTFKENCLDLRNTKVVDVIKALRAYGMETVVVDSVCSTFTSALTAASRCQWGLAGFQGRDAKGLQGHLSFKHR